MSVYRGFLINRREFQAVAVVDLCIRPVLRGCAIFFDGFEFRSRVLFRCFMCTIWVPSTGYLEISVFRENGMELNGMKKGIARSFSFRFRRRFSTWERIYIDD